MLAPTQVWISSDVAEPGKNGRHGRRTGLDASLLDEALPPLARIRRFFDMTQVLVASWRVKSAGIIRTIRA